MSDQKNALNAPPQWPDLEIPGEVQESVARTLRDITLSDVSEVMFSGLRTYTHPGAGFHTDRAFRSIVVPGDDDGDWQIVPGEVTNSLGMNATGSHDRIDRPSLSVAQVLRAIAIRNAVSDTGHGPRPHILYMPNNLIGEESNVGFRFSRNPMRILGENALWLLESASRELGTDIEEVSIFGPSQGSATGQSVAKILLSEEVVDSPALALMETPNVTKGLLGLGGRLIRNGGPLNAVLCENFVRAGLDIDNDTEVAELLSSLYPTIPHSIIWGSSMTLPSNASDIWAMSRGGAGNNIEEILTKGSRVAMWAGERGVSPIDATVELYERLSGSGIKRSNFAGFITPHVSKVEHHCYIDSFGEEGRINDAQHSGAHNWPRAAALMLRALDMKKP